jgi:AMMECR1 domain-containing protein
LREAERAEITRAVRSMLRFQRDLTSLRPARAAPDATPFVALYANGRLCGCYGSDESCPAERLARAFLRAAHDPRFGGISAAERGALVAQVSYVHRTHLLNPETAADDIEVGIHGVALVREGSRSALLLPHVARDQRAGPLDFLRAVARKAGLPQDGWRDGTLYRFETQDCVVRARELRAGRTSARGRAAAGGWLASMVDAEGAVTFAIDPRARRRVAVGEMHHARAAELVRALAAHGGHPGVTARARQRLERDIRAAMEGREVAGWPDDPEKVVATMALAVRAGVPLQREILAFLAARGVPRTPWHAAQVVAALGPLAPPAAWETCISDLDRHAFAPWTLIGAIARGDDRIRARAARAVAGCIREDPPHRGGASITLVPETALTGVAAEGLAQCPTATARAATARARDFLARAQLLGERIYAALDPSLAHGAFAASPVSDVLRCDVTAHALLAMAPR